MGWAGRVDSLTRVIGTFAGPQMPQAVPPGRTWVGLLTCGRPGLNMPRVELAPGRSSAGFASDREQSLEEFPIALQSKTEVLRRGLFASSPLRLEP